jgi:uncharacterized protein YciW
MRRQAGARRAGKGGQTGRRHGNRPSSTKATGNRLATITQ